MSEIIIKNIELLQQVDQDLIRGEENILDLGQEITEIIIDSKQTNVNQLQGINKKFDYLNKKIETLQSVGEDINDVLLNKEVTKDNQVQVISKKFDYLNEQMATILTLAENNNSK